MQPAHLPSRQTTPVAANAPAPHSPYAIVTETTASLTPQAGTMTVDRIFHYLDEAVEALRNFEEVLSVWQNESLPGIFR